LSEKKIEELNGVLDRDIPKLMEQLPSEKDSPESLRAKMGINPSMATSVPVPNNAKKFGRDEDDTDQQNNPFGFSQQDEVRYWALQESADRLRGSFEALRPQGGYLSTQTARDVLVKTGLEKEQLRLIWNLSDIDRDGLFDHDEYVVAMFLCDAVIQKGRPIPKELPPTVIPPSKRELLAARKLSGM
jgi:Cytoskeletal-regulatory complex EF hand